MNQKLPFSLSRLGGIIVKEFTQMRRDRITFAMMLGVPLMQLVLFGFAINSDPKHLPTGLLDMDRGPFARSIAAAMKNSGYYDFTQVVPDEKSGAQMLNRGQIQFLVTIPADFSRDILRGANPKVLVEADATDPAATGNAISALGKIAGTALMHDLKGPAAPSSAAAGPFEFRIHGLHNPEGITQYNIVPGLMGVILTMTMIMITGLAITRERERGTMENLLAMPTRPMEVLVGKILPYIIFGYLQVGVILVAARILFGVPFLGSLPLLLGAALVFITANLAMGITFSTIAANQLQAMQLTFFFFLPSILLSGFMFPFRGMPIWAQWIGQMLPLTHFLRIVRGVLLKGSGIDVVALHLWPIAVFTVVMMFVGIKRYRQTLD